MLHTIRVIILGQVALWNAAKPITADGRDIYRYYKFMRIAIYSKYSMAFVN